MVGKEVKKEFAHLLVCFNFGIHRQKTYKFIELLSLLRIGNLLSRPTLDDAIHFLLTGEYDSDTNNNVGVIRDI